jgi:glycosyltransferase involved in cell wall biosynthesis
MKQGLFLSYGNESFVTMDYAILSDKYRMQRIRLPVKLGAGVASLVRQIAGCDFVFAWFASVQLLSPFILSRMLGRPILLIVGGYDVANMPSIDYGSQRHRITRTISRFLMRHAASLVTFSYHSRDEAERNAGIDRSKVNVVYLGVPDRIGTFPNLRRDRVALSIGNVNESNLARKGHEVFVRAAGLVPDAKFVLAGAWSGRAADYLKKVSSPNVLLTGWLEEQELLDYYTKASVIVQPSRHEGFGLSVAEGMLAGCIPVVTRVGSLPEVVGETGVYIEDHTPEAVGSGVRLALDADDQARMKARQRILELFPVDARARSLYALIDRMMEQ